MDLVDLNSETVFFLADKAQQFHVKEEVTIFVSTAYLDEAERCTRIGLMHEGKVLMKESPSQIKKGLGHPVMEIWTGDSRQALSVLKELESVRSVRFPTVCMIRFLAILCSS